MVRTLVLAVVTLGVLALAAHDTYADCGQWYPFYGYRQPNYLAQPSVVYVQPAAPQAWTTYYAPAPGAAVPRRPWFRSTIITRRRATRAGAGIPSTGIASQT